MISLRHLASPVLQSHILFVCYCAGSLAFHMLAIEAAERGEMGKHNIWVDEARRSEGEPQGPRERGPDGGGQGSPRAQGTAPLQQLPCHHEVGRRREAGWQFCPRQAAQPGVHPHQGRARDECTGFSCRKAGQLVNWDTRWHLTTPTMIWRF